MGMAGIVLRKISPKIDIKATPGAKPSTAASKKRGAFAAKMSKISRDASFGPSATLGVRTGPA